MEIRRGKLESQIFIYTYKTHILYIHSSRTYYYQWKWGKTENSLCSFVAIYAMEMGMGMGIEHERHQT